ncbi:MAG: hypothetical protein IJS97_06675 [Prevotella sp.]|nr:hypothetical protein [Prevotella sp.]
MATFALPGNLVSDIVQPCFIASFLFFFNAYQDKFSPGWVFFSFLFIGIASIFFVPMLFYLPLLWILLGANVLALSLRNFCASLLGILLPFWVVGSYALYADRLSEFGDYCLTIGSLGPLFDYSQIALPQIISFAFVVVLLLTGTVHFLRNSYRDKIRTRMIYESLITIGLFTVLFILAQPQHYNTLMRVLIVVTSPLIAHFIALTETRITNIATIVIMVVTFLITFCNRWMLSLLS